MISFDIRNRWTGRVQFTAQIDCAEDAPQRIKVGLALKWGRETRAVLTGADLRAVRADFYDGLIRAIPEVPALLEALRAGKIDGSTYTGECACLAGTIAKARHVGINDLGFADASRPAEKWFLAIREGATPDGNSVAKITESWILDFMAFVGLREAA